MSAALIFTTLFCAFFIGSAVYEFFKLTPFSDIACKLLGILAGQGTGIGVAFRGLWLLRTRFGLPPQSLGLAGSEDWGALLRKGWRIYLRSLPGLVLLLLAFSWLAERYHFSSDRPALQEMIKQAVHNPATVLLFFAVVSVGAPIYEELLFRGILYSTLRLRLGTMGSLLTTAFVFAMMHDTGQIVHDPRSFPLPILYLGIVLGLIRERTESVVPGMAVHALNNCIALAMTLVVKQAV